VVPPMFRPEHSGRSFDR